MTLQERVIRIMEKMLDVGAAGELPPLDNTTRRALRTGNISVRSLARIADTLGYEVVLMVRKK